MKNWILQILILNQKIADKLLLINIYFIIIMLQ